MIEAARATGTEIVSEIELAYRWEQERPGGPRPMLAVTGTDGKTTTTLMTVAMLRAAGLSTVDAGNTETPLVDAIDDDHDAFVVECTSFRLAWTHDFRAEAAAWLNLAPDHLNWHASMDTYEAAKARIWAAQRPDDVAIAFTGAPDVMRRLRNAPGRQLTFGPGGDYHLDGTRLVGPAGPIATTEAMRRSLPHDITNALAASAMVLESRPCRHAGDRTGAGRVHRTGASARTPRNAGRCRVVQRLEGNHAACRSGRDPRLRRRRPHRRWEGQARRSR